MDLKLAFGVVASVVAVASFLPYLRDIQLRKTEPHSYSWLIWTILQVIATVGQLRGGSGWGSLPIAIGALLCFLIFLFSLSYGTKNITRFDSACLAASLVAIVFLFVLKNPFWSILVVVIVDLVGYLPTMRKGYQEPFTETPSTFALSALSQLISLFAIRTYSATTVLYIATLFVTNSLFVAILLFRRKALRLAK